MTKTTRKIGQFTAVSDDGTEYTVIEYHMILDTGTKDGGASMPVGRWLRLKDGSAVDRIDSETFKIAGTDQIIRKLR